MPPRMTTQSAGRSTVASRDGRTGRGGGRTGEPMGRVGGQTGEQDGQEGGRGNGVNGGIDEVPDFSMVIAQQLQNLLPTIIAQVGNHASNIHGDVRNVSVNNSQGDCSYKEFLACNPKDYDGKGGAIVYTHWTEKMELVQTKGREAAFGMTWEDFKTFIREELCPNNKIQNLETEFWCHTMVEAGYAAYTDRFHELARLVSHLVTPKNKRIERYIYVLASHIRGMVAATEPTTIQSAILKVGVLTDKAIRNGSLKKNNKKRGNSGEPSRDGHVRDNNKRSKTGRAIAITTNRIRREYTGHFAKDCRVGPRTGNLLNTRNPTTARGACFECSGTDHYKAACLRLNRAPRQGGNRPNQALAIYGGQGRGNNGNPVRGRAFVIGAEEARHNPNIMTGTFTLNNHYATTLFDFGADYNFVSTTFIPLLGIEPSSLGFSYEIEIASGQLVGINKIIRGCKLKIEGCIFNIKLIPFEHGSFDVIMGIDWLSRHKAEIVCHEKVVRIPLPNGKMLRVLGEIPVENVRHLKSAKAKEQKLKDILETSLRYFLMTYKDYPWYSLFYTYLLP
ncbi:putative reverse transcriptase domain-containing protein [Tanacetum coccineum]